MFHFQQQAQEKDAEVHRQQRGLHTLRVRTWCYELAFVTLVEMAGSGTQIQKDEQLTTVQQLQLSLT